jgi:small subunit ribosomal protein S2
MVKSLVKKALVASKKPVSIVKKVEVKVVEVKSNEPAVKADKKYNLTIGLKDLLGAGCHLGHKISKTNPKAKEYIYAAKDGIQIIDLTKTLVKLEEACNFVYNAKRNGKIIALVGTKRQAREVVRRVATDAGLPYITDRWLGGTVSNFSEIKKNIKRFNEIKTGLETGKYAEQSKKDQSMLRKEYSRLTKMVGGLASLDRLFDVLFVVDAGFEKTGVKEATDKKIKTVGICDTDSNPMKVDFPIPANDDNVKSISLIIEEIGRAIKAA